MDSNALQILDLFLTSGVLIILVGVGVKYGRLIQKVEGICKDQVALWTSHRELDRKVFDHIIKGEKD